MIEVVLSRMIAELKEHFNKLKGEVWIDSVKTLSDEELKELFRNSWHLPCKQLREDRLCKNEAGDGVFDSYFKIVKAIIKMETKCPYINEKINAIFLDQFKERFWNDDRVASYIIEVINRIRIGKKHAYDPVKISCKMEI